MTLMSLKVKHLSFGFEADTARALFKLPSLRFVDDDWAYSVARDNRRFLMDVPVSEGDRSLVVVLNWAADLRSKP